MLTVVKYALLIISTILTMIRDNQQRGLGRMEATKEALANAHRDIAIANAADDEARRAHNSSADDSAFDREFER